MKIIVGNIFTLIASLFMIKQGLIKEKDKIIYFQSLQFIFYLIGDAILGGLTGALVNALNLLRNILYYKNYLNTKSIFGMVILLLFFINCFNELCLVGFFPFIIFIICTRLLYVKDIVKIKLLMIITLVLWIIYDFNIQAYTSIIFELIGIIVNGIFLIKKQNKTL